MLLGNHTKYGYYLMKIDQQFNTYNKVNKSFIIVTMTIKDVVNNKQLQDKQCLILIPRLNSKIKIKTKKKTKKSKIDLLIEEFRSFKKEVILRLDKHDELFRAHGWIK